MKILIHDHGICLEAAITLARAGHTILYYCSSVDTHSLHTVSQIGSGFESEGVTKVDSFWDNINLVDLICCFDTHFGDEVDWLRSKGYKVFGAGRRAERLELDRWHALQLLAKASCPLFRVEKVEGVAKLITVLKSRITPCWVKCSGFREIETFHHTDWAATQEQFIAPLLIEYGTDPSLAFILASDIDPAIEVGSDNLVINGQYPSIQPYGYEAKDSAYIGKFNSTSLPKCLEVVNCAILPELVGATSFVSTEVRVTPSGEGYPVDLTIRAPHPPMAAMLEALKRIEQVLTLKGGLGLISPRAAYAAVLCGSSGWATEHRCEISFPDKYRQWVKLSKAYKVGDKYFTVPSTSFPVQVVGIGSTIDQAIEGCKLVAEEVHGKELSFDFSALDKLQHETIPQGRQYGITF